MEIRTYVVDAFTDRAFNGNPAAVCLLESELKDVVKQNIAQELNLSETAFLERVSGGNYRLRWFTPSQEVPLCGHATLASAHVLWSEALENQDLRFQTLSGELKAAQEGESIVLDFPSEFTQPKSSLSDFAKAVSSNPVFVGESNLFWLVELDSEVRVRELEPDFSEIAILGKGGLIVTAKSDSESDDFVSRVFAPNLGVPEDPVTGSAHCILGPYWSKKLGLTELTGFQASSRGGYVKVDYRGARTLLKGKAVTTLRGNLTI